MHCRRAFTVTGPSRQSGRLAAKRSCLGGAAAGRRRCRPRIDRRSLAGRAEIGGPSLVGEPRRSRRYRGRRSVRCAVGFQLAVAGTCRDELPQVALTPPPCTTSRGRSEAPWAVVDGPSINRLGEVFWGVLVDQAWAVTTERRGPMLGHGRLSVSSADRRHCSPDTRHRRRVHSAAAVAMSGWSSETTSSCVTSPSSWIRRRPGGARNRRSWAQWVQRPPSIVTRRSTSEQAPWVAAGRPRVWA